MDRAHDESEVRRFACDRDFFVSVARLAPGGTGRAAVPVHPFDNS
jgi:hypothetical protein